MYFKMTPNRARRIFRWFLILSLVTCCCGYFGIQILAGLPELWQLYAPPPATLSPAP